MSYFFSEIAPYTVPVKPRTDSLNILIDWGFGTTAQADVLETGAAFLDMAKIAVGIGRLLPAEVLTKKVRLYQEAGVEPFPGGQFLEYAHVRKAEAAFLAEVARAGFRWCEVSDNLADVPDEWKPEQIRRAFEQHGLQVLGEVGKKEGKAHGLSLVKDAEQCLAAGASFILLEAAEIISRDPETVREIDAVIRDLPLPKLVFELPGPWIHDVTWDLVHQLRRQLFQRFGPAVNLANVPATEVVLTEALRHGLGVNAGGRPAPGSEG